MIDFRGSMRARAPSGRLGRPGERLSQTLAASARSLALIWARKPCSLGVVAFEPETVQSISCPGGAYLRTRGPASLECAETRRIAYPIPRSRNAGRRVWLYDPHAAESEHASCAARAPAASPKSGATIAAD